VNYDLSHAVAILQEVHVRMAAEDRKWRLPAMADLELTGVPTGALRVSGSAWDRRKKAAAAERAA